jgi:hypothetical protein
MESSFSLLPISGGLHLFPIFWSSHFCPTCQYHLRDTWSVYKKRRGRRGSHLAVTSPGAWHRYDEEERLLTLRGGDYAAHAHHPSYRLDNSQIC